MRGLAAMLVAGLALTSCTVAQLVPARDAGGSGQGPVAAAQGVTLAARTDAWDGEPGNLETVLTPIWVTVANDSGRPIALRPQAFAFIAADGRRFMARPPDAIEGSVLASALAAPDPLPAPQVGATGLMGSTAPAGFPDLAAPWEGRRRGLRTVEVGLPTADMVEMALPSGPLPPGGTAEGFLYFPDFAQSVEAGTLVAALPDAEDGGLVARLDIRFVSTD